MACAYTRACVRVRARAVCNRACTYADTCDRARAYVRAYVHMRSDMAVIVIRIGWILDVQRKLNIESSCTESVQLNSISS